MGTRLGEPDSSILSDPERTMGETGSEPGGVLEPNRDQNSINPPSRPTKWQKWLWILKSAAKERRTPSLATSRPRENGPCTTRPPGSDPGTNVTPKPRSRGEGDDPEEDLAG